MEPEKISKNNVPMACAALKDRAAIILFYLANSGFTKKDLIEVVIEALRQLEWLGYPSVIKRVKRLVYGLSRSSGGKDGAISDQNGAWGTSPLENPKHIASNNDLNRYYHDLVFHPCDAMAEDSRQKIQNQTKEN